MINRSLMFREFVSGSALNLANLSISFVSLLIIPKVIGVEEFALWQLFVLYAGLVVVLHFGLVDGVYLRYGGRSAESLPRGEVLTYFFVFVAIQAGLIAFILFVLAPFFEDGERLFVFFMVGVSAFLTNSRGFLGSVLLGVGKVSNFLFCNFIGQLLFLIAVIFLFFTESLTFERVILADLAGKLISLILVFRALKLNHVGLAKVRSKDFLTDTRSGFPIVMGYLIGVGVVSAVKLVLDTQWDLLIFGQAALMIAIIRVFTVFTQTAGFVLFPELKKNSHKDLEFFYEKARIYFCLLQASMFLLYFPVALLIDFWLSDYSSALYMLAILFPAAVFEMRTTALLNPSLKASGLQKHIMYSNFLSLLILLSIFVPLGFAMNNPGFLLLGVPVAYFARSQYCDWVLRRYSVISAPVYMFDLVVSVVFLILYSLLDFKVFALAMFLVLVLSGFFVFRQNIMAARRVNCK